MLDISKERVEAVAESLRKLGENDAADLLSALLSRITDLQGGKPTTVRPGESWGLEGGYAERTMVKNADGTLGWAPGINVGPRKP